MNSKLVVELIPRDQKDLLRNLMQPYGHDLSEFNQDDPDDLGSFGVGSYFDAYWTEATRYPFKILAKEALAGFALIRELEPGCHSIAEFFILRRHRRSGIGRDAAQHLFSRFPGIWHVAQDEENVPAQRFWRKIIGEYTNGDFKDEWSVEQPTGPKQVFSNKEPLTQQHA